MGKCSLITIILRVAISGLLLWLAVAGFTKVGKEIGSMYMESSDVGSKDLDGAMRNNKEKVNLVAGSRPAVDLNYASERRVPRGPDPIHNRRAGDSRQPPGQAECSIGLP